MFQRSQPQQTPLGMMAPGRIALLLAGLSMAAVGCGSPSSSRPSESQASIAMSIAPASGSGRQHAFTASYVYPEGVDRIATVRLLLNRDADGRTACYVYYDRASKSFLLVNDSGEGTTRLAPGDAGHLENGQCVVDGLTSSVTENANELKMTVSLAFKLTFQGKMNIYLYSDDASGHSTGFQSRGTWELP
jgi:hypothetical protein